jgi:hypothetical protein
MRFIAQSGQPTRAEGLSSERAVIILLELSMRFWTLVDREPTTD